MARPKRRLRNYLINPRIQLRFFMPYLLQLVMVSTLIEAILYYNSKLLREAMVQMGSENSAQVTEMFLKLTVASGIALVLIAIAGFCILLVQSHRLLGPIVPITRFIRNLADGNYELHLGLRKHDELKQIADELNNLAKTLKEKHPPRF